MNKTIYVVVSEGVNQLPYWERMTVEAIYRRAAYRRMQVTLITREGISRLPHSAGPVLIVAPVFNWMMETIGILQKNRISCIVVGSDISSSDGVSVIRLDQAHMAEFAARYFYETHHRKLAFLAYNMRSTNDKAKAENLKRACAQLGMPFGEKDMFLFSGDIRQCISDFARRSGEYDAVLCANDVSGLQLMRSPDLLAGRRIPEDLYVISYGNTLLSRLSKPTLTTISLDYSRIGSIAVDNVVYLRKNPDITCQHTTLRAKLTLGASTNYEQVDDFPIGTESPFRVDASLPSAEKYTSFYSDATAQHVLRMEELINKLDKTSLYIVLMLLRNYRKDELMEALYISESTYKYRLRKICTQAGVKNRHELVDALRGWIDPEQLDAYLANFSMIGDEP